MLLREIQFILLAVGVCAGALAAEPEVHVPAIRDVLKRTWERANWPLSVEPVVVDGDAALASWVQGHHGGRVLLRLEKGVWVPKLCGGDQLKTVATLVKAGVTESNADRLVLGLSKAEVSLSAEARRAISSYRGLLNMNERSSPARK
jgi:hypothetical protein